VKVEIESDLPIGAGLGSSAAYAAALSGALCKGIGFCVGVDCNSDFQERVWGYTNVMEKLIH
jgi:mevalonate kinase